MLIKPSKPMVTETEQKLISPSHTSFAMVCGGDNIANDNDGDGGDDDGDDGDDDDLKIYSKTTTNNKVENHSYFIKTKLFFSMVIFTIAYCIQPLLIDGLKYQGAATASTFIYLLPHYAAMLSVGIFRKTLMTALTWNEWKKAIFVSSIDLTHQVAEKSGLVYAGSAVYVIVSSSSIVWTAIISYILLKKRFSLLQWISLFLICVGLGIKSLTMQLKIVDEELVGVILTLCSSILHALTFVMNEKYLTGDNAISGPSLVFMMGMINTSLLLVWYCVWTIPNFYDLIVLSVIKNNGNWRSIIYLLFGIYICGFVHSSTLWYIVKSLGAVSSGVFKGIKATSVFILGHIFFCHLQSSQCLSGVKVLSASICVAGVMMYGIATFRNEKRKEKI